MYSWTLDLVSEGVGSGSEARGGGHGVLGLNLLPSEPLH